MDKAFIFFDLGQLIWESEFYLFSRKTMSIELIVFFYFGNNIRIKFKASDIESVD